ncbi:hypothetical protein A1O3_06015 [Capronia epimyces CBS 606.96]|uniref:Uncharacterized protein n=1 Tax=Capronia epimyces CBS 606.96 TaxID=1182542 RepID=W9XNS0_9EURO|nr:uncharacterized protein A1O3_06015 [Capronia epimyces CBS 606.96]EXJ82202.1 hypothetical protein A1O3_06015 [Capronia epimyces CBS 606.96]
MGPLEVDTDEFEVGKVFTGPDSDELVLFYEHRRFILMMTKPETREDDHDHVVADLLQKIEEANDDPDPMTFVRCLEDVEDLAISACKQTLITLATSGQQPNSKQTSLSLEDFLYPPTFYLQLHSVKGTLQAVRVEDVSEIASMLDPVHLTVDLEPGSVPELPSVEIEVMEDLFMRQILKVKISTNGQVCVFKSATYGNEDQLKREINVLRQISETWEPGDPSRLHVPRLLGLATSGGGGQILGILEEFVDGTNLYQFNIDDAPSAQRQQ